MAAEFRTNTYTNNWQFGPDIARLADGGFIVVWDSYFNQYDDGPVTTYVAAQRYDAFGHPVGGEMVIDAQAFGKSATPSVTVLSDGGYVVLWEYDDYDAILTLRTHVYAQVFNSDGTARGAAFQVDTVAANNAVAPEAFATANGGFRVTFGVDRSSGLFSQVYSRLYDGQGVAQGADRLLNTNVGDLDQIYVRSVTLQDGRSLSVWNSVSSFDDGSQLGSNELRGTLFDAAGRVLRADFHLSINIGNAGGASGGGYDVAALADGGFVVSHRAFGHTVGNAFLGNVVIERFDANGQPVAAPFLAASTDEVLFLSRVVQLSSGALLVVWSQYAGPAELGEDVMARLFSVDGRPLGRAFEVGVDRFDGDDQALPEVVALAGGGFAVVYQSDSIDPDHEGIAGRIFGRGTAGADALRVDQSGDMAGLSGHDTLMGNGAANSLTGGAGRDVLTGGGGADSFVFARPQGVDRITDFTAADRIVLEGDGFGGLAHGALSPDAFRSFGRVDTADRILYNAATGAVFYDANGSGAGGRVQFAQLTPGTDLTAADFWVL